MNQFHVKWILVKSQHMMIQIRFLEQVWKGFFTGRSKTNNFTTQDSSYNTMDRSSYSSLVSNNDQAFSGNPLKALKHGRK